MAVFCNEAGGETFSLHAAAAGAGMHLRTANPNKSIDAAIANAHDGEPEEMGVMMWGGDGRPRIGFGARRGGGSFGVFDKSGRVLFEAH